MSVAVATASGCGGCPTPPDENLGILVVVENGAWGDACAYDVEVSNDDFSTLLDCSVSSADCHCSQATAAQVVEVTLIGKSPNGTEGELESMTITAGADACAAQPSEVVLERPPIEDFSRAGCPQASDHLVECGLEGVLSPADCVDTLAEPGEPPISETNASYYGCFTAASCSVITETYCQPNGTSSGVSSLVACVAGVLGFDATRTEELADLAATTCGQ